MNQPSSRNLSHDYPAWKGLSLRELSWIVITATPAISALCAIVGVFLGFPIAGGCLGFIIGFILSITLFPKQVARRKAGKPPGYLRKKTIHILAQAKIKPSPWVHYQGSWHKNKRLRG